MPLYPNPLVTPFKNQNLYSETEGQSFFNYFIMYIYATPIFITEALYFVINVQLLHHLCNFAGILNTNYY